MTVRDFITECELYPYSKQRYSFLRECYELDMMTQYIENLEVANSGIVDSPAVLTEGYIYEAVDDATYEVITEKFGERVKNLKNKFVEGLKKLWEGIKGFFKSLFGKVKTLTPVKKEIKKELRDIVLTKEDTIELGRIFGYLDNKKEQKENKIVDVVSKFNQPARNEIRIRYTENPNNIYNDGNDKKSTRNRMENCLAAVLSESVVNLVKKGNAIDPEKLISIAGEALALKKTDIPEPVLTKLRAAKVNESGHSYITIPAGNDEINKFIDTIAECDKNINKALAKNQKKEEKAINKIKGQGLDANSHERLDAARGFYQGFDELYVAINRSAADTMKLLKDWQSYQTYCLGKMKAWLKTKESNTPDEEGYYS